MTNRLAEAFERIGRRVLPDRPSFRFQLDRAVARRAITRCLGVAALINLGQIALNRYYFSQPGILVLGLFAAAVANLVAGVARATFPRADFKRVIQAIIMFATVALFFSYLKFLSTGGIFGVPEMSFMPTVIVFIAIFAIGPHLAFGRTAGDSLRWSAGLTLAVVCLQAAAWASPGQGVRQPLMLLFVVNLGLAWVIGSNYEQYFLADPGLTRAQSDRGWKWLWWCQFHRLVKLVIGCGVFSAGFAPYGFAIVFAFGWPIILLIVIIAELLYKTKMSYTSHLVWFGYEASDHAHSPGTFQFSDRLADPVTRRHLYMAVVVFNIMITRVIFVNFDYQIEKCILDAPWIHAFAFVLPLLLPFVCTSTLNCRSFFDLHDITRQQEGDDAV